MAERDKHLYAAWSEMDIRWFNRPLLSVCILQTEAHPPLCCCRVLVLAHNGVAALVDMATGSDSVGAESAAAALLNLAVDGPARAALVAANGVQALLGVLHAGGPSAQEAAAGALENLSTDDACEGALVELGAAEALVEVLRTGNSATQVGRCSWLLAVMPWMMAS